TFAALITASASARRVAADTSATSRSDIPIPRASNVMTRNERVRPAKVTPPRSENIFCTCVNGVGLQYRSGGPWPDSAQAMLTPSFVVAYWTGGGSTRGLSAICRTRCYEVAVAGRAVLDLWLHVADHAPSTHP